MTSTATGTSDHDWARLARVVDQQEIADVIYRYCRGIDRCDFDLVRSCYHPDAIDDHGDFRGGVDEFIAFVQQGLPRFERTMHFIGNVLVEVRRRHGPRRELHRRPPPHAGEQHEARARLQRRAPLRRRLRTARR